MTKTCKTCMQTLPAKDFYRYQPSADHLDYHCKACKRANAAANRERHLERYREYGRQYGALQRSRDPEKVKARKAVWIAVRDGHLTKLPCRVCGTTEMVEGHHEDYSRPLDVIWLCRIHHAERHSEIGERF